MAQDPPPPNQPNPSTQSSQGADNSTEGADPASPPTPAPAPIQPAQAARSFYFRPTNRPPIAPGYFTGLNLSAGYSVTNLSIPTAGRVALSGVDVTVAADGGKRIGAKLDLSYTLAPNVSSSGHRADVFSYLVGPTISLWNGNSLSISAQVLAGGARVAAPFRTVSGGLDTGHVHYPAWEFGGSAEYGLSRAFGFRVTVDCLHTYFFDSSGAVRGQNNIRVVNSIVYYLGEPVRSKRR